jgi:hypothetical protein
MPPSNANISELKAQLAASRSAIQISVQQVEDRLNVSKRIREDIQNSPIKWLTVGAGISYAAIKILPFAFRLTRKSWMIALVAPLLRTAIHTALPVVADNLLNKRFKGI